MAVERVTDGDDPRLIPYRDLRRHDDPARHGLFVAEARAVVRQLLLCGRFRTHSVLLTDAALPALTDVLPPELPVYLAPPPVLKTVVGFDFHRGCVALAERPAATAIDDVLGAQPRRLVLLDEVRDPDNVGAIFRNALAFGVDAVILSAGSADPLYRKAVRVSSAATLRVPFARAADWPDALARVRAAGLTLIALAASTGVDVASLAVPARSALVVGSEGDGLGGASRAAADVAATIPMAPGVDSLNVATACGIALHRLARGGCVA